MNIFVGNLAPQITEAELVEAFKAFGDVKSAQVVRDMFTGISKGFGFVEMPGKAHRSLLSRDSTAKSFCGKPLRMNESRPKAGGGGRRS